LEGKVNGTKMIYTALCKFLNVKENWKPELPEVENNEIKIEDVSSIEETLRTVFKRIYDIRKDDENMKKMSVKNHNDVAAYFDLLRKEYPLRREFNNYNVIIPSGHAKLEKILSVFRFNVRTY
jgi:erythronate-4-phosphate dehydrogenase